MKYFLDGEGGTNYDPLIFVHSTFVTQVVFEESSRGCSEELFGRIQRYYDLADKYNLKLVAGTYVKVPWSPGVTEEEICRLSKCTGAPFPG